MIEVVYAVLLHGVHVGAIHRRDAFTKFILDSDYWTVPTVRFIVLPAHGEGGDWIVKIPDAAFPRLPANELAVMGLARDVGIEVPEARMVRRTVFNLLVGNGDAHLKNWSLIYPDRKRARLSPAYDLVCTAVYLRSRRSRARAAFLRSGSALRGLARALRAPEGRAARRGRGGSQRCRRDS